MTWISIVMTAAVAALLINIFEHKQESKLSYLKIVDVRHGEPDPSKWAVNFPREYEAYMKTMKTSELIPYSKWGRYGGSEAFSQLERHPDLKRMFAGYPFSVEYNEDRGHMNALTDMLKIKRLGDQKPGSCMTCKSPQVPLFIEQYGAQQFYNTPVKTLVDSFHFEHSISCADCHHAETMALEIRRPAFIEAMARRGIDVATADRQAMRVYVCAQCHVEYYWQKEDKYLTFPWSKGLVVDSIEAYYDSLHFKDWEHGETKAPLLKMQHPEFELYSTGIHARSGVSCVDCHMPYTRQGSIKVTDHWIRTPLVNLNNACLTCHRESETEMRDRVIEIQDKTYALMTRADHAIISALDGIQAAMAAGGTDQELASARALHRRAQMRWDFISAENSMGFHSPQEAARVLGDAIDYARQAELAAFKAVIAHGGALTPVPAAVAPPVTGAGG
ncbi:ammonia-forming cytochrome c nitrite reductase subunit c552 [candidate division KSB1 bacterium]|nr:ammonia-forming cytochrome c nitrite reductase subunit c552 [candidate division KSB1 bacterium]